MKSRMGAGLRSLFRLHRHRRWQHLRTLGPDFHGFLHFFSPMWGEKKKDIFLTQLKDTVVSSSCCYMLNILLHVQETFLRMLPLTKNRGKKIQPPRYTLFHI